jgi:hypothetical protein
MATPWIKVPFILAAMCGLQITATPPQPPPSPEEEGNFSTRLEVLLRKRSGTLVIKVHIILPPHEWSLIPAGHLLGSRSGRADYDRSKCIALDSFFGASLQIGNSLT